MCCVEPMGTQQRCQRQGRTVGLPGQRCLSAARRLSALPGRCRPDGARHPRRKGSRPWPDSSSSEPGWPGPRPPRRCASAGLHRGDHADRRRARNCPTSGRRCRRATSPATSAGGRSRARRRVVRRARRRPACSARRPRASTPRLTVDARRRRRSWLRQAAAGHRLAGAPAAVPRRRCRGRPHAAHGRGLRPDLAGHRRPVGGSSSSAPAGSAWRSPRPPATPAPRSPWSKRRAAAGAGARRRARGRCSPTCTASTASTSGSAPHVAEITDRGRRGNRRRLADGTRDRGRRGAGGGRRRAEPRAGRRRGLDRRQRRAGRRVAAQQSDPDIFAVGDIANAAAPRARPHASASSTGPTR